MHTVSLKAQKGTDDVFTSELPRRQGIESTETSLQTVERGVWCIRRENNTSKTGGNLTFCSAESTLNSFNFNSWKCLARLSLFVAQILIGTLSALVKSFPVLVLFLLDTSYSHLLPFCH